MALFSSIYRDLRMKWDMGEPITRLVFINVGVFLAVNLVHLLLVPLTGGADVKRIAAFNEMMSWISMPYALLPDGAGTPNLLTRPWTLITHFFVHEGLWHILWNMLFLYWFGSIFALFLDKRRVYAVYMVGGLVAGLVSWGVVNLTSLLVPDYPLPAIMYGASGAVSAVLLAAATIAPDYEIRLLLIGNVKIKYIALFRIILDLIAIPGFGNFGGVVAHLAGAAFGYLYVLQLQQGNDLGAWYNSLADRVVNVAQGIGRRQPRVVYKRNTSSRRQKRETVTVEADSPQTLRKDAQVKVDSILDRISKSGYDSLSKEEKEFLFRYSKED